MTDLIADVVLQVYQVYGADGWLRPISAAGRDRGGRQDLCHQHTKRHIQTGKAIEV
jgi:hypothetical protein